MPASTEGATFVVSRRIKPGQEDAYEDWLRRIIRAMRAFPGYMGVTTLSPEGVNSNLRYLVLRFDSAPNLDACHR